MFCMSAAKALMAQATCRVIVVHAVCHWHLVPYLTAIRTAVQHVIRGSDQHMMTHPLNPSPVVHLEEPAQKQQLQ